MLSNSLRDRDIASQLHPQTNLSLHEKTGPVVMASGQGVEITDTNGKTYIEGMSGLWCTALGLSESRLAEAATRQMGVLPYYQNFAHRATEPGIQLAETLLEIAPVPMSKVPAQTHFPQMRAVDVFLERQNLYCGRNHPLGAVADCDITPELLAMQAFAGRSYMPRAPICGVDFRWSAVTAHMESTLLLLLSGAYIGFLPDHYAAPALHSGALRALDPGRFTFEDTFQIVYSRERPTRAVELLVSSISRPQPAMA